MFGKDITGQPPYRIAAAGVGYVPEGRRVFANLTVDENLRVPIERPGPVHHDRVYALFPRLARAPAEPRAAVVGRRAGDAVHRTRFAAQPPPADPRRTFQGLAPLIVKEVFRIVAQMRAEGISVLLVEQNVRMSLEISDHAYVLENGQMVYSGPAAELRADETRIQALAGASAEEWKLEDLLPV